MTHREAAALAYVEHEILVYLGEQPDACDTLEGITNWWLHRQRLADGPVMVRKAVTQMVAEGDLFAIEVPSQDTLYAASPAAFPPTNRKPAAEE